MLSTPTRQQENGKDTTLTTPSPNNIFKEMNLNNLNEESTSIGLVGLFFILFSIVATILVPIGWYTHSCHLIVPHLIMQFAVLSATLVIMCYIMAWIFGGIDLQINAVFFEHSPLGEEGIRTASQRTPIEANLTITHMQMILAAILFLLAVVFLIELLFFHIMLRVFRYIRDQNGNKLESNNNSFVKVENGIIVGGNVQNDNNLRSPPHNQQQQSPPSLKTCANISSPQLPNTSTTSTTATFSINSSPPPPLVLNETNRILQPTIQIPGNQRHPYNSHSSPAVYYEVQPRKELHV
uniref:Uncharacterized protein n=1 Tax=Meloidogyne javanica TaxID=6303 RepID=A0A915LJA9_MELJA